jgi:co-chaperonin GroES (HSP10)
MRNKKIGVEKASKQSKKDVGIWVAPDVADSYGIIRYLGPNSADDLKIGMKVYYGTQREQVRMAGSDIEVMNEDNVIAIVQDEETPKESQN